MHAWSKQFNKYQNISPPTLTLIHPAPLPGMTINMNLF